LTTLISKSFEETINIGREIGAQLRPGNIVCLEGDLGAGKTSLTKGIALALDIPDEITSPTYTLISEYYGTCPLYHMDLYRIDGIEEFEMLGAEDLLFGRGISVIEWSERIEEYLPEDKKIIKVTIMPDLYRKIEIEGIEV
jgi:tRNA threonylcarbamoyladenosine biosynthesis protein TsaE